MKIQIPQHTSFVPRCNILSHTCCTFIATVLKMCLICRAPMTGRSRFTICWNLEAKDPWRCWGTWVPRTGPWWFHVDGGAICIVGYCRRWQRWPAYSSWESSSFLTCISFSFNIFCESFICFLGLEPPFPLQHRIYGKIWLHLMSGTSLHNKQMQITYLIHISTIDSSRDEIHEKNSKIHLDRLQNKYTNCKGIKNNTHFGQITGTQEKLDTTCK